jgi:hypothetical protein
VNTARTFVAAVVVLCAFSAQAQNPWKQPNGLVPDKQTAIKIAEAILFPIYGEDTIKRERPYRVSLRDGCWYISGSMPHSDEVMVGGTFFITISQWDGRVIQIGHLL